MPRPERIVIGQRVDPVKKQRARELRREMTPEERLLWARLRANRLEGLHFRRQQVIDGFILDFYCHAAAIGVEVDGSVHHQRAEYDEERSRIIAARGIEMLRFTNDEIRFNLEEVLIKIAGVCKGRLKG
jgi:very-short-patch-repair endonuclease